MLKTKDAQNVFGHAPQRTQNQFPDKANDDKGKHGGHEERRAEKADATDQPGGEDGGQEQADRILHHHMDEEEDDVMFERPP